MQCFLVICGCELPDFWSLQKQVKRHNCKIPVKFPCSRGAWQILSLHFLAGSHHLRHISRSLLQSIAWDSAVEERCFLTMGQESCLEIGQQRFVIFSPLLFPHYSDFKEQYFRWLVSYLWKESKSTEGEQKKVHKFNCYKNESRSVLQIHFFQNTILPLYDILMFTWEWKQTGQEEIYFSF